jgi:hypothetical protein
LAAAGHGVDDHLLALPEDQHDRLQQARVGVETEPQFPVWRAVVIERLDPERPLSRLNGILDSEPCWRALG